MRQLNIIRNRKEYIVKSLEFNYDKLNDLLYVYKRDSNVYSNVVIGDFHLELDRKMGVVGLEVLRASELLGEYGISKEILESLEKVSLKVITSHNSVLVFLGFFALNQQKSAAITMNNLESPVMKGV
ncbi:MAG: hypothetical protein KKG60_02275 [Nanoarchaeota archaeon]|nr:hypothetical protein [Nanoarchaeota archaeon]